MSCFSELALDMAEGFDNSYPSPERQLLWRLDELQDKLTELTAANAPYRGGAWLTDEEIRYADPEWFETVAEVERAIALVNGDFKRTYGVDVASAKGERQPFADNVLRHPGDALRVA